MTKNTLYPFGQPSFLFFFSFPPESIQFFFSSASHVTLLHQTSRFIFLIDIFCDFHTISFSSPAVRPAISSCVINERCVCVYLPAYLITEQVSIEKKLFLRHLSAFFFFNYYKNTRIGYGLIPLFDKRFLLRQRRKS